MRDAGMRKCMRIFHIIHIAVFHFWKKLEYFLNGRKLSQAGEATTSSFFCWERKEDSGSIQLWRGARNMPSSIGWSRSYACITVTSGSISEWPWNNNDNNNNNNKQKQWINTLYIFVEGDSNISLWCIKIRIEQVSSIHNCEANRMSFIIA